MSILITAEDLHGLMSTGERAPRVLDVRWKLGGPPGKPLYREGHLPDAVYVDLDTELAGHGAPQEGRHPLPRIEDLEASARRWGIAENDTVVVYDDLGNLSASRAWWLLRHAGIGDVRLLDGGLAAWKAAAFELQTGDHEVEPGDVSLAYGCLPTLDADEAARYGRSGILLDARAPERYRGEVEPIDPMAGHIPGAINAPAAANLDSEGRFVPAAELRAQFEALGVTNGSPVGVYCGSGVTAAAEVAALAIAGFDAALFPGSWSAWSNDPDRPVATGAS